MPSITGLLLAVAIVIPLYAQGSALLVGPASLSFNYVGVGAQPLSQTLLVASSGVPLSFSTSAVSGGGNWLSVGTAAGTTPATLSVSVNPGALTLGTYQGSVILAAPGAVNPSVLIAVNLTVRNRSQIAADPRSLSFQYQTGAAVPASQKLTVTSNGGLLTVLPSVETSNGGDWLQVSPAFVSTGEPFEVSISPANLAPGNYTGVVAFTAAGTANNPIRVTVNLTVSASPFLVATGGPLVFTFQFGGPSPLPQFLTIASTGGSLDFSVTATTSGGDFLRAAPASSTIPATVTVNIDPTGLTPANYAGFVNFIAPGAANSPLRVPVTLSVTNSALLTPAPAALNFDYQTGGALPSAQPFNVDGAVTFCSSASLLRLPPADPGWPLAR